MLDEDEDILPWDDVPIPSNCATMSVAVVSRSKKDKLVANFCI